MLAALGTLTQTAPAPAAIAMWSEQHGPIRTVATTLFVAGSILETLGPPLFTTQTAPGVVAIPSGWGPTGIVAASELSRGSIRKTLSSDTRAIQSAPLPAAASPQLPGNSVQAFFDAIGVRATTVFVPGSIRIKIGTASLVTQTAPSPTARAPEFGGIEILATTLPTPGRAARPGRRAVRLRLRRRWQLQRHQRRDADVASLSSCFLRRRGVASHAAIEAPPNLVPSGITLGSAQIEGKP